MDRGRHLPAEMLNDDQFPPHEWIDVQETGVYFGDTPMRHARVYRNKGEHNAVLGTHEKEALGRFYEADIPTETGWAPTVSWDEWTDRPSKTAHVTVSPPEDYSTKERAAHYRDTKDRKMYRRTVRNAEEMHNALDEMTRRPAPRKGASRTSWSENRKLNAEREAEIWERLR